VLRWDAVVVGCHGWEELDMERVGEKEAESALLLSEK